MGTFSYECKECGYSILSPYAINKKTSWMCDIVYCKDETNVVGQYDGYGRIKTPQGSLLMEIPFDDPKVGTIRHLSCWRVAGKPGDVGPSEYAQDQGHFIDDNVYESLEDPQIVKKPLNRRQK